MSAFELGEKFLKGKLGSGVEWFVREDVSTTSPIKKIP